MFVVQTFRSFVAWLGSGAMFAVSVAGALSAQQDPNSPDAPVVQPAEVPPAESKVGAGLADELPFARVETAVDLQVFPTTISPIYGESLSVGTVVRVGASHEDFREVHLPLGVLGFVHKDFTTAVERGVVRSKQKIAFRYRPKTGEAPVAFVNQDVDFPVVDEQGEWWVVRYVDGIAWVPASVLSVFGPGEDTAEGTLAAAWAELENVQRQSTEAWWTAREQRAAAELAAAERDAKLAELRTRLETELAKPIAEQDYGNLSGDVEALVATIEPTDEFHAVVARLRDRIATQVTVVEATRFVRDEPKPAEIEVPIQPAAADPLARFDAIGWIKYERSLTGKVTLQLEKGGQVLHDLTCSSGRYDLAMFHGLEVGLIGPRARSSLESIRSLDVDRLEVLRASPTRRD